jgi:hypothetical protein
MELYITLNHSGLDPKAVFQIEQWTNGSTVTVIEE